MPIKKAAMKALRQTVKRTARNTKWHSDVEALVRRVRKAIAAKDAPKAKEWMAQAVKKIDRAASRGVLKRNTARRRVSRLQLAVNKLVSQSK